MRKDIESSLFNKYFSSFATNEHKRQCAYFVCCFIPFISSIRFLIRLVLFSHHFGRPFADFISNNITPYQIVTSFYDDAPSFFFLAGALCYRYFFDYWKFFGDVKKHAFFFRWMKKTNAHFAGTRIAITCNDSALVMHRSNHFAVSSAWPVFYVEQKYVSTCENNENKNKKAFPHGEKI